MQFVSELMISPVLTVSEQATMREVWETLRRHRIRHLCVVDDGNTLVGVLSDRDVARALPSALFSGPGEYDAALDKTLVYQVMSKKPVTVGPRDSVAGAVASMLQFRVSCVPVVDKGALVGLVTTTDCLSLLKELLPEEPTMELFVNEG